MPFLQKKHFRWKEPKEFLRLQRGFEKSKVRWWHQPVAALFLFAMLMASWYGARLDPAKQPLPLHQVLPLALGVGVFLAYFIPWVSQFYTSHLYLYDTFLMRLRGNTQLRVQYDNIASFSWLARDEFATLILRRVKPADEVLLGVPNAISQEALSQFLLDHEVPHQPLT